MDKISFRGQLTEAEFREIQSLAMRKVWRVIAAVFLVLMIMNLVNGMWRNFARNPLAALITWMPIVLLLPVVLALQWFTVRRHWRTNRIIQLPVSGTVSDEGIDWNVEGQSSSRFAWSLLLKYRASGSLYLVYSGLNQVLYFPRHYFASDQDWARFQTLVAAKLPKK